MYGPKVFSRSSDGFLATNFFAYLRDGGREKGTLSAIYEEFAQWNIFRKLARRRKLATKLSMRIPGVAELHAATTDAKTKRRRVILDDNVPATDLFTSVDDEQLQLLLEEDEAKQALPTEYDRSLSEQLSSPEELPSELPHPKATDDDELDREIKAAMRILARHESGKPSRLDTTEIWKAIKEYARIK